MDHPQFAFTGPSPAVGYVGFINIMKTDTGVRFSVRSEAENSVQATYEIPLADAITLLEGALIGLKGGEGQ